MAQERALVTAEMLDLEPQFRLEPRRRFAAGAGYLCANNLAELFNPLANLRRHANEGRTGIDEHIPSASVWIVRRSGCTKFNSQGRSNNAERFHSILVCLHHDVLQRGSKMNPSSDRSPRRHSKSDAPGHRTGQQGSSTPDNYRHPGIAEDSGGTSVNMTEAGRAHSGDATAAVEDIAGAASQAISAAARAVASQASEIVGDVAEQLGSSVDEQKGRGADSLVGFAHAIKTAAAELEGQSPVIARKFRGASDQIERFSGKLRDRRVEDLVTDYSDLAKTQPVAFFAGALIAGFALSRFIKSSAPSDASSPDQPQTGSEAGA